MTARQGSIAAAPATIDVALGSGLVLLRQLGEGAHGVVYEAEQSSLRRRVVVKLLREHYSARPEVVDRLRLEAQAIAALAPLTRHVVAVLDHGRTSDGRAYIVMERLEGRTLREELATRQALPVAEAVGLACQVLDGLAVAHDAGIVHRDIKPDNVFLCETAEGRVVKLLDFGIAKVLAARPHTGERAGPSPLAKPTDTGMVLGTPRYFSPEQARGEPVTSRADLYSVAALLYKMVAGRDAFAEHRDLLSLSVAHLTQRPRPPSEHAPQPIPPALDEAILRGMEKRPADRYPSARAFRAAIEQSLRAPSHDGAAGGPKPRAPAEPSRAERWLHTLPMHVDDAATLPVVSRKPPAPADEGDPTLLDDPFFLEEGAEEAAATRAPEPPTLLAPRRAAATPPGWAAHPTPRPAPRVGVIALRVALALLVAFSLFVGSMAAAMAARRAWVARQAQGAPR